MTIDDQEQDVLFQSREEIVAYQQRRLGQALDTAWNEFGFYRRLFERRGIAVSGRPEKLNDWPLWNVADLRVAMEEQPPFGDLYTREGLDDIMFIHSSSGTTGKPRYAPFTAVDGVYASKVYRRVAKMMGNVGPGDVFCITGAYGLTTGSWSYTRMTQAVGAAALPVGSGRITPSNKLLDVLEDIRPSVVHGAPSYLLHVGKKAREQGVDLAKVGVRLLWLGGEGASSSVRKEITELWNAPTTTFYANSDLGWVGAECEYSSLETNGAAGMHIFEDQAIFQVLDAEGNEVADHVEGEAVITSWLRPSTPRIRFRTGDRTSVSKDSCPCGMTAVRMLPISGRTDDAIRFHGVTIWPSGVEDVLVAFFNSRHEYVIERRLNSDRKEFLRLLVEHSQPERRDGISDLSTTLREKLNVTFDVAYVAKGSTAAATGIEGEHTKVNRVVDLRDV